MSNVILGIDIGASGAVALLTGAGDLMDDLFVFPERRIRP
jgi:hypothetical protein